MNSIPTNLNNSLDNLSDIVDLPLTLPLTHLSIARWFKSIVADGELRPRLCSVFNENLTYLFYGGVFYRPSNILTRNAMECPVAFVFTPLLLEKIFRLFPFDTGALQKGLFGNWSKHLLPYEKFEIRGSGDYKIASKLVHYIFGENELYLKGYPRTECKNHPDPFPLLFDFYSEDLTASGVDQRQCTIECQGNTEIPFKGNLLWIGFPESMTDDFAKLQRLMEPEIPLFYPYSSHAVFNPIEIAAKLEEVARIQVIERFLRRIS